MGYKMVEATADMTVELMDWRVVGAMVEKMDYKLADGMAYRRVEK